ncbi:MAG: M20/M25/M40 family metallo-hydrolase [Gemmatimonadaceae bacterium]
MASSLSAGVTAWHDETRDITLHLVGEASVTSTSGEVTFAAVLRDLLACFPYFQRHPQHLRVEPIPNDAMGRANVIALVRGAGRRAVALTGHYDVVSTSNYGDLEPWAVNPTELLPRLIDDLRRNGRTEGDARALRDLESGDFLPGRGALDMKSGLAAGIAVLRRFAEEHDTRQGNLIFVATPDEENRSAGMRAAAPRLAQLAREWKLDIYTAINLDATGDLTDGSQGQVVYMGSVGKLLISLFVAGRDTHAGYPFDGINANYLAAQVTSAIECNAELADTAEGEAAPPPTTMKQMDLKVDYDVTTPAAAWACYNLLTHRTSAEQALTKVRNTVQAALREGISRLSVQAQRYAERQGQASAFVGAEPVVMTLAELRAAALQRGGEEARIALEVLCERLAQEPALDLPSFSRIVTEHLWRASGLTGPAAVLGFASLPYPSVHLDSHVDADRHVRDIVRDTLATLRDDLGVSLGTREFFQGISDMSFLGGANAGEVAFIADNTPPWGTGIRWPVDGDTTRGVPTINAGPWGRDFHQRLERVFTPYSFGVLPEVIWRLSARLLGG